MRNEARLRLLLAESGSSVGGTERVVWELATRLSPERFEVHVWLSPSPGVDELADSLADRGIAVDRVQEIDSRWDVRGMLDTWQRLRTLRPRVLHVHHVWPAADRYLSLIAGLAGVQHLVVTEHIVGHSHSATQRALKRRELSHADAVTAVCGAIADALVRDYGVDRSSVRIVGNGADPADEPDEIASARRLRQEVGARQNRPLWVCAARLEAQKGQDVLLEALAELRRRDFDFLTVLAGEGSRRDALERQVRVLGLENHVRLFGQVEAIGPLLMAADVVVLPSRWEGLPLSLLEAMVRARPIVASAVGGVPEVLEDRVHGLLVPPGDPVALSQALAWCHGHAAAAVRLGERAAERVRRDFTWERVVERFESVYDEVVGLASFAPPGAAVEAR